ncbi:MAG: peptidoglycan-associated lipoprotein Pal [Candidatus Eisenbacteria bacterium]|nr:peptidoglycan-associated lipoprotein Pal [Candidatus Eisenbacteria bacterium]
MKVVPRYLVAVLVVAVVGAFAAGCAKKAREAPPVPPPAPPVVQQDTTPTPVPPPTPPPVTPSESKVTSSDFQPAFFEFDSYALRDDARAALDGDAKLLREHAEVAITLEGHCDERGTVEYNQALGEKRAQAARDYLVAAGIGASRIQTISYGKERPFADGHDETAWAQNRRAHPVVR